MTLAGRWLVGRPSRWLVSSSATTHTTTHRWRRESWRAVHLDILTIGVWQAKGCLPGFPSGEHLLLFVDQRDISRPVNPGYTYAGRCLARYLDVLNFMTASHDLRDDLGTVTSGTFSGTRLPGTWRWRHMTPERADCPDILTGTSFPPCHRGRGRAFVSCNRRISVLPRGPDSDRRGDFRRAETIVPFH